MDSFFPEKVDKMHIMVTGSNFLKKNVKNKYSFIKYFTVSGFKE